MKHIIYDIDYTINDLFNTIPDTELIQIIEESINLLHLYPEILQKINDDQDRLAKQKKKLRLEDQQYYRSQNRNLPGFDASRKKIVAEDLELLSGRERMKPQMVFLFMMLRGYFGSVTNQESLQRMYDSYTLHIILRGWDKKMPGVTTILENLNCISNDTRDYVLDCQIKYILDEGLDNFKEIIVDSTHVEANTEWPTDAKILFALLHRAFHYSQKLSLFRLDNFKPHWVPTWEKKLKKWIYKLNMTKGKKQSKGKIKKYYRKILEIAQKIHDYLISEIERMKPFVNQVDICPSLRVKLKKVWNRINNDVLDSAKVIYYTHDRIFNEVVLKASEKILSISDRSAAFIKKGSRNPVIGYKPQIVRSGNGFIPALSVPEGNTNDSKELVPVVKSTINRTGVMPRLVSADDGYASAQNRAELLDMGIAAISLSGAKGKKITPVRSWNSKTYQEARRGRSAVESSIFTLKHLYEFGDLGRRGIEEVTAELLEKVIVFNFARIIKVGMAKQAEAEQKLMKAS